MKIKNIDLIKDENVYLAYHYTDQSTMKVEKNYKGACRMAAFLMDEGINVFSPISHGHRISKYIERLRAKDGWPYCVSKNINIQSFEAWKKLNDSIIEKWATCMVYPGILETLASRGVQYEKNLFDSLDKPVYMMGESKLRRQPQGLKNNAENK
jgi:hypothetical protein